MPSPIAHSLMGLGLYNENAPARRRRWPLLALLVFLANAPDLDFLPGLAHHDAFLFHRAVTHSLFFAVLSTIAVWAALAALRRPLAGRLAQLTLVGLLSHIVLDYFCGTQIDGVALLWPLSDERFAAPVRVFPKLLHYPLVGRANFNALLVEVCVMMIVLEISAAQRLLRSALRHPRVLRRAAEPAPSGAEAELR